MQQRKKWLYFVGAALLCVMVIGAILFAYSLGGKNTSPQQEKASPKSESTDPYANAKIYKLGETVHFASVDLVVNSAKATDSISSSGSSPVFADKGAKFVVINLTVTNTTKSPFTYKPFEMVDQKNRMFESYENTIGNIDNYINVAELAPSIPKTGNAVYQVPKDATTLKLGGYVGNTNKLFLVEFDI